MRKKQISFTVSAQQAELIRRASGKFGRVAAYCRDASVRAAEERVARFQQPARTEFRGSSTVDFSENQDRHREVIAGVEHVDGVPVKRGNGSSLPPGVVNGSDLL